MNIASEFVLSAMALVGAVAVVVHGVLHPPDNPPDDPYAELFQYDRDRIWI